MSLPRAETSVRLDAFASERHKATAAAVSDSEVVSSMRPTANKLLLRRQIAAMLIIADLASILCAFALASVTRLGYVDFERIGSILMVLTPIFLMFSLSNDAHAPRLAENLLASIRRGLSAFLMASVSLMLLMFFLKAGAEYSRVIIAIGFVLSTVLICTSRYFVGRFHRTNVASGLYSVLTIHAEAPRPYAAGGEVIHASEAGLVPDHANAHAMRRLGLYAQGMDRIVVHCDPRDRDKWAMALKALDVPSEIAAPELNDLAPLGLRLEDGRVNLLLSNGQLAWNQRIAKRIFDVTISLVLLPVLLPLFGVIAIAIKLDSRGPVFFRQERIGLGNRSFGIWKFRSMRADSTDIDGDRSTERDDQRVTRVGRFIRNTSLDELPQIVNVIGGSMSLVGPRPHASGSRAENLLFWDIDHRYWHRHAVKPGLTGLAQVRGLRGSTNVKRDLSDRLQADLEYVANWTLLGDIRIILQTFSVLAHRNAF